MTKFVLEKDAQYGKRAADGGLGPPQMIRSTRNPHFLHQNIDDAQEIEVNLAGRHSELHENSSWISSKHFV
ncbi:hypothetical protein RCCGEPOP_07550 [Rhizobium sp. Pop5]|nr:hypothetical protein RCCGEPOP_07550 [Rhizobium sp. Pop5]